MLFYRVVFLWECDPTPTAIDPFPSLFTIPFLTKEIELPYWEVLRRGGCTAAHARQLPGGTAARFRATLKNIACPKQTTAHPGLHPGYNPTFTPLLSLYPANQRQCNPGLHPGLARRLHALPAAWVMWRASRRARAHARSG